MFLLLTARKQKVRHLGVFQWYNFQSSDPKAEMGATKTARRSTDYFFLNAKKESRLGPS
jgi:hypothetical protein